MAGPASSPTVSRSNALEAPRTLVPSALAEIPAYYPNPSPFCFFNLWVSGPGPPAFASERGHQDFLVRIVGLELGLAGGSKDSYHGGE